MLEAALAVLGGVRRLEAFVSALSGGKRRDGRDSSDTVCCVVSAEVDSDAVVSLPGDDGSTHTLDVLFLRRKYTSVPTAVLGTREKSVVEGTVDRAERGGRAKFVISPRGFLMVGERVLLMSVGSLFEC